MNVGGFGIDGGRLDRNMSFLTVRRSAETGGPKSISSSIKASLRPSVIERAAFRWGMAGFLVTAGFCFCLFEISCLASLSFSRLFTAMISRASAIFVRFVLIMRSRASTGFFGRTCRGDLAILPMRPAIMGLQIEDEKLINV